MVKMFSSNKIFESEKKRKQTRNRMKRIEPLGLNQQKEFKTWAGRAPSKIEKLETERERIRQKSDEITEMGIF